jgi:hypothetical protein
LEGFGFRITQAALQITPASHDGLRVQATAKSHAHESVRPDLHVSFQFMLGGGCHGMFNVSIPPVMRRKPLNVRQQSVCAWKNLVPPAEPQPFESLRESPHCPALLSGR